MKCGLSILSLILATVTGSVAAEPTAPSTNEFRPKTVNVQTVFTGVGGRIAPGQDVQLQAFVEVALLSTGSFQLSTNADFNVNVRIVNYVQPAPARYRTNSNGKRVLVSSGAGGVIAVLTTVSDRQGKELKTFLVSDTVLPDRLPSNNENALQRVAGQIAMTINNAFGR